jgi:TP901 family phage tail tape measure protein
MGSNVIEVVLRANVAGLTAGLKQAAGSVDQLGTKVRQSGAAMEATGKRSSTALAPIAKQARVSSDALGTLGTASIVLGGAMVAGFGLAVRSAAQFESTLSELRAVSGATASEMGVLRQQALDMGAATAFSANEAAQAQVELSKAGMSTADILGGALAGAMSLASAGGIDLATSAETMADSLSIFGLEAGAATHAADVLAAGAGKSSADVGQMSQALQQSGLVAAQLGVSLEETVGTLSAFHQAGLKGSDAGTSFKTMLGALTPNSVAAAREMERLGLTFFDAQGEFIGVAGAAEELRTKLANLTPQQRAATMETIFGQDAVRAASILFEEGAAGVQSWTTAVNDSGYASEVAATRLDNLSGDLEALRGSIDTALIQGGSMATGVLRELAQGATDSINAFSGLPGPVQAVGVGIAGIGGAGLLLAGGIAHAVPKVRELQGVLATMGKGGQVASNAIGFVGRNAGTIIPVVAGLAAAWQVYAGSQAESAARTDELTNAIQEQRAGVEGAAEETLGSLLADMEAGDLIRKAGLDYEVLTEAISTAGDEVTELHELFRTVGATGGDLGPVLRDAAAGGNELAGALSSAWESGQLTRSEMVLLVENLNTLSTDYAKAEDKAANAAQANRDVGDASGEAAGATDELTGSLEGVAGAYDTATDALKNYIDQQQAQMDPLFAALNAQNGVRDAQLAVSDAYAELTAAQGEYDAAVAEHGASSAEAADAMRAVEDAQRGIEDSTLGAAEAALTADQAMLELADAMRNGEVTTGGAAAQLDEWVASGWLTETQARKVAEELGIVGMVAEGTAQQRVDIPVTETGAVLTRSQLHGVRDAAMETDRQRPVVSVAEAGSALTFGWLRNVTGAARETGSQRPRVGVSETGSAGTRSWLDLVTSAANRIPGSRNTRVTATDLASSTLRRVMDLLSAADGRTANTTITTTHRQVFVTEQRSGHTTGGPQLRWGGIVHARNGYEWEAKIAPGSGPPVVHWGERETGGEAYIPRVGKRDRSLGILDVAAGWYGMSLVPQGQALHAASGALVTSSVAAGLAAISRMPKAQQEAMRALSKGYVDRRTVGASAFAQLRDRYGWRGIGGDRSNERIYHYVRRGSIPDALYAQLRGQRPDPRFPFPLYRTKEGWPVNTRWRDLGGDGMQALYPPSIWRMNQLRRGYANGGIINGLRGEAQGVIAHGGEMVLNAAQQARLFNLANESVIEASQRRLAGLSWSGGDSVVTFAPHVTVHVSGGSMTDADKVARLVGSEVDQRLGQHMRKVTQGIRAVTAGRP